MAMAKRRKPAAPYGIKKYKTCENHHSQIDSTSLRTFSKDDPRSHQVRLIGHQNDCDMPSFFLSDLVQSVYGRLERLAVLDGVHDHVGVDLVGCYKTVYLKQQR